MATRFTSLHRTTIGGDIMPTENYTSKFRVDVSDLKKGLADANAAVKKANAEFKNATAGTKEWQKSADGLNAAITAQKKVVEEEQKKLDILKEQLDRLNKSQEDGKRIISDLNAKYDEAAKTYGATSEEAQKYAKQLSDAEAAQERNRKVAQKLETQIINQDTAIKNAKAQVSDYESALDKLETEEKQTTTAAEKLDDNIEEVGTQAQKTTDGGLSSFAVALGNLASTVITGLISKLGDLAKATVDSFDAFEKGRDEVIKATGAVGDAADELTESYAKVAKEIYADNEDIGKALGEVNTRFAFTGDQLEDATLQFMKFSEITGTDAVDAVRNVSRAIESSGADAEDYAEILDMVAVASQATGISADTLLESLTKYGAQMRAMNYDTADTISLLANFEKNGINAETAINGLRKAQTNFAKEGKDAKTEIQALIEEIKNAPDETTAAEIALENFGSKAGTELSEAIRDGRFEFSDFTSVIEDSAGAVSNTFAETVSGIDTIRLAAQNLKTTLGEIGGNLIKQIAPNIEEVTQLFSSVITGEEGAAEQLGEAVGGLLTNLVSKISELIPQAVQIGVSLISSLATGILEALPNVVSTIADSITIIISSLGELIPKLADKVLETLPILGEALYNAIPQILSTILGVLTQLVDKLPDFIEQLLQTAPKVWQAISNALQNGVPKLVEGVKKLIMSITKALPNVLKVLTKELPKLISGAIDFYATVYPLLLDALLQISTALLQALPDIIGAWNEAAPDLLKAIGDALVDNAPLLVETFKIVWGLVFDAIPPLLKALWDTLKVSITTALSSYSKILKPVAKWVYDNIITPVIDFFSPIAQWISDNVFTPIMDFFKPVIDFFSSAFDIIFELAEGCWKLIKGVWEKVSDWFKTNVIKPVEDFFKPMWDNLKAWASDAWDGIKTVFGTVADFFESTFRGAWEKVKAVFSVGGKVFDGIKEGIVSSFNETVNALIRGINKVVTIPFDNINNILDTLQSIEVLGMKPFENLVTRIDIPQIPELEYGAVMKRGQVGLLEGKNDEAIIPLQRNMDGMRRIAGLLAEELKDFKGGDTVNNYNFTQTNNSPKALSRWEIYQQSKNLFNAAVVGV